LNVRWTEIKQTLWDIAGAFQDGYR